jgi:hypothetical protein
MAWLDLFDDCVDGLAVEVRTVPPLEAHLERLLDVE